MFSCIMLLGVNTLSVIVQGGLFSMKETGWNVSGYGFGIRRVGDLYGKAIHVDRETLNHQLTGPI